MPEVQPVITVFLVVRDEADTIDEQLAALADQDLDEPWELIVADTGSSDDTVERTRRWLGRIDDLIVVELETTPRFCVPSEVIALARSEQYAFCDGDDVVSSTWLSALHRALREHEFVTGPLDLRRLNPDWVLRGEPVGPLCERPYVDRFLPFALGCNLAVRKGTFHRNGGFDDDLYAGVDRDLSWRLQLAGVPLHFAHGAVVHRRMRSIERAAFHQHRRYGAANPVLYRRYRRHGVPRDSMANVAAVWAWIVLTVPALAWRAHRLRWCRVLGLRFGRLEGSLRQRVWFP